VTEADTKLAGKERNLKRLEDRIEAAKQRLDASQSKLAGVFEQRAAATRLVSERAAVAKHLKAETRLLQSQLKDLKRQALPAQSPAASAPAPTVDEAGRGQGTRDADDAKPVIASMQSPESPGYGHI